MPELPSILLLLMLGMFLAPFVAEALCTGIPSGCCGHDQTACESISGCTWMPATPGNTLYGKCEGYPIPCSTFSDNSATCLKQPGCTYGPNQEWVSTGAYCTGTTKPPPQCTGTAPSACSGGVRSVCESAVGCTFVPGDFGIGVCRGTPTPCGKLSGAECNCMKQAGCTYYQDPPDPRENFYDAIMPLREGYRECYGPDGMYAEVSPNEFVWMNSVVICEKCRPTLLGRDVCYWTYSSWDPSLVFHSCVMKIGDEYCTCTVCEEGGTAFNCQDALDSYTDSDVVVSSTQVVGRDCSGNCIRGTRNDAVLSLSDNALNRATSFGPPTSSAPTTAAVPSSSSSPPVFTVETTESPEPTTTAESTSAAPTTVEEDAMGEVEEGTILREDATQTSSEAYTSNLKSGCRFLIIVLPSLVIGWFTWMLQGGRMHSQYA